MISLATIGILLGTGAIALILVLGPKRLIGTIKTTLALWWEALRS